MEDVAESPSPAPNPWLSIWRRPRATIRRIVESDPERHVTAIAAITGLSSALNRASNRDLGDRFDFWQILAIGLLVGPLAGVVGLYLVAALVRWSGKWLGGQASTLHLRAAMAWASVPLVAAAVLWIPELLIAGREMFTAETPRLDARPGPALLLLALVLLEAVAGAWAFVLSCKCVGEVQGFSAWKALGNLLLAFLVFALPFVALGFVFATLGR